MYRKSSFRVCVLSVLLSIVPSTHAQELLTNPGFEEGTNTIPWNETIPPTGWQEYSNWGWAGWKQNTKLPSHIRPVYLRSQPIFPQGRPLFEDSMIFLVTTGVLLQVYYW